MEYAYSVQRTRGNNINHLLRGDWLEKRLYKVSQKTYTLLK